MDEETTMAWQEYLCANSVAEALALLHQYEGQARLIAGGTDLVLQLQKGERTARCLVDVTRIAGLQDIRLLGEEIVIGAAVTHAAIAASPLITERATVLQEAALSVGTPQIRNVGTLVGNVVNAQPGADGSLALLALDATLDVVDLDGNTRRVPVAETFVRPDVSTIDPRREMVTLIRFPALAAHQASAYVRLARRRAAALPVLAVGVVVSIEQRTKGIEHREKSKEHRLEWVRIALGPVALTPYRARQAEEVLRGAPISPQTIEQAAQVASQEAQPRSSVLRGSREYRQEMVRVYMRRALETAAARLLTIAD
jgi:carbon-monoxide dehydrogenase medium subunit